VLPDFVVSAGGVIGAATEYHDGTEARYSEIMEDKIRQKTDRFSRKRAPKTYQHAAARALAIERIRRATRSRRWR
jgi:glutamate dehydrogenase (NAD(P)+)